MTENAVLGLDIGSAKVSAVICEINDDAEHEIKGIGTAVSSGIDRGQVVDEFALSGCIQKAIDRAASIAGYRPERVVTTLPQYNMQFAHHAGYLQSKSADGCISAEDAANCFARSKDIVKDTDQKLVHAIPIEHLVDQERVESPVGYEGKQLEIKSHLVLAPDEAVDRHLTLLNKAKLTHLGSMLDIIATAQVMLTGEQRQTGAILIDMGSRLTRVGYFYKQKLVQAAIIKIGGDTVTSDIATCLETTFTEAERIKILFGAAFEIPEGADEDPIKVSVKNSDERRLVEKRLLSQVMHARLVEWAALIKAKDFPSDTPIHICGGGSLIKEMRAFCEKTFDVPVSDGLPDEVKNWVQSHAYATAVGLILGGIQMQLIQAKPQEKTPMRALKRWSKKQWELIRSL